MMPTGPVVYRIYSGHRLLYIGCTQNLPQRLAQHGKWMREARVDRVALAVYPTLSEARQAEWLAIYSEKPLRNVACKRWAPREAARGPVVSKMEADAQRLYAYKEFGWVLDINADMRARLEDAYGLFFRPPSAHARKEASLAALRAAS